jgi:hypothetical protein
MPEDRSPDRDHAAKQREADQRASFVKHCQQDGLCAVRQAKPHPSKVDTDTDRRKWVRMLFAQAAAKPAPTWQAALQRIISHF